MTMGEEGKQPLFPAEVPKWSMQFAFQDDHTSGWVACPDRKTALALFLHHVERQQRQCQYRILDKAGQIRAQFLVDNNLRIEVQNPRDGKTLWVLAPGVQAA
jgi:hypothetical protein